MKQLIIAGSFVSILLASLSSCKKESSSPSQLIGEWKQLPLDGLNRSLKFTEDQSFLMSIKYGDGGSTVITGTYQTKNDSLMVITKELQQHSPGQPTTRESSKYQLYENATFKISNNILTLDYTTYPADAPLPTTAKFQKQATLIN